MLLNIITWQCQVWLVSNNCLTFRRLSYNLFNGSVPVCEPNNWPDRFVPDLYDLFRYSLNAISQRGSCRILCIFNIVAGQLKHFVVAITGDNTKRCSFHNIHFVCKCLCNSLIWLMYSCLIMDLQKLLKHQLLRTTCYG